MKIGVDFDSEKVYVEYKVGTITSARSFSAVMARMLADQLNASADALEELISSKETVGDEDDKIT